MYFYSAATDSFIPESLIDIYLDAGTLPVDLIEVNIDVYEEYAAGAPPEGKVRGNVDGLPVWVDIPPPTLEELIEAAGAEKARKLEEVANKTELWRSQLGLGIISDSDRKSLTKWVMYAQALQELDLSTFPDIAWPSPPKN